MNNLNRIAFIGNSLPRRCGIATFTTDLQQAVSQSRPDIETSVLAMTDHGQTYAYPKSVGRQVRDDILSDYVDAADWLNRGKFDIVCLQHEFGIFGGEAGRNVLALLSRLKMPIVTTFHTVLADPSSLQRDMVEQISTASSGIVLMAEKGRQLMQTVYQTPTDKIEVIPHGIPDVAYAEPHEAKVRRGFAGKSVILTFGLLSPNKGIEVMIDAMPSIIADCPDAIYVVLGATHPNLVRREGEAYRERLVARAKELGVRDQVIFLDQFVDRETLLDFISMCDVYVTPYLSEAQMTSGTLAYSFGLGKAVVSTPYWHARELLADGRGILVPFGDSAAIGKEIRDLLIDPARREAMRARAYQCSRSMTWARTADAYAATFSDVIDKSRLRVLARSWRKAPVRATAEPPEMRFNHLLSMCDSVGLYQHAVHCVPDRAHGYCVDDNARALLLACALGVSGEQHLPEKLSAQFSAFVQHAWNPDRRRFRNFMSFDRRWLEDCGSEDSHGRTVWALGVCARDDVSVSRRGWASALFAEASPVVDSFQSPRALAFALLGLDAYCGAHADDLDAQRLRTRLADRLMVVLAAVESGDWTWFEEGLSYDNARLPQALLVTGLACRRPAYVDAGLRSLRWLMSMQKNPEGQFRPVGSGSFGDSRAAPRAFDQQPLEATATISACLAAWRADGDVAWKTEAKRAFDWFLGANDLGISLVDPGTGSCRDGLHPDRANENRGGESVVSYLFSLAEIRQLVRVSDDRPLHEPLASLQRA
ncbi:MAG: glycosyltransferase family 4 protein [Hyphomonadaceae bacterium]|nr:MAG: group 1 glycosyl transferase [Caulobacteraceae bacterium]MBT9445285.1 glycosyltransferase family 4 protein [Hyphomonadaceae bacterium]TPW07774.1 MAG: group 1 glycosyl transferase [Alphaproteobacteria bacterium]